MMESVATRKRVSIKDIAEAAGVSHPTVSRALRGQGRMADETRTRIVEIAQELGYTPSLVARGLVTQQSFTIGLVVTNFADPFYSGLAQGLDPRKVLAEVAHANERSHLLALVHSGSDAGPC